MIRNPILKLLLFPFYLLYAAGVRVRNALYDGGWKRARRLPRLVVSVGNLTTGGTGKTPFVMALAAAVDRHGIGPVTVLSRGYRRQDEKAIFRVEPGDRPDRTGDEPLLIARSLPGEGRVWVGADRYAAGQAALAAGDDTALFLLDDGFQHRKLHRDLDIVLVDATRPFGGGRLIPYGMLREPATGLQRADIVVLTRSRFLDDPAPLMARVRELAPEALITTADLQLLGMVDPAGEPVPESRWRDRPVVSFSGIGNPLSFKAELVTAGMNVVRALAFPDHATPSPDRMGKIDAVAKAAEASYIVTTEKDWVKLAAEPDSLATLSVPLLICRVAMAVSDMDRIVEKIKEKRNAQEPH